MSELKVLDREEFASLIAKGLTLVDFVASCSPPCASREHLLLELGHAMGGGLSVVRVDLDVNPDLVGTLGVVVLPALMLFQDGTPQWSTIDDLTPELLAQCVEHTYLPSPSGL